MTSVWTPNSIVSFPENFREINRGKEADVILDATCKIKSSLGEMHDIKRTMIQEH